MAVPDESQTYSAVRHQTALRSMKLFSQYSCLPVRTRPSLPMGTKEIQAIQGQCYVFWLEEGQRVLSGIRRRRSRDPVMHP